MAEALTTQEQLVRGSSRFWFFFNQSRPDYVNSVCQSLLFSLTTMFFRFSFFVHMNVPVRDV